MSDTVVAAIIGVFELILCIPLGYYVSSRLNRQSRILRAEDKFRDALNSATQRVISGEPEEIVIEETFQSHVKAVRVLANTLLKEDRISLYKIWNRYQGWYNARCNKGTTIKLFPETDPEYALRQNVSVKPLLKQLFDFVEPKK